MVQAGGPAAINGFLFQILNHLAWFADIRIGGMIAGRSVETDAYVVLEPPDGGDARYEGAGSYIVEQYKARPNGTWSINGIIDGVLPDLRKAVREPTGQKGNFFFVTDGREGRLNVFNLFLAALRSCATPADIDNTQVFNFGNDLPPTQRLLFAHIVEKTRSAKERRRSNEELSVLELLQQFEMRFEVSPDSRAKDVERLLRFYSPNLGDESGIRERLIGVLMTRLANGEVRINAGEVDDILKSVGLNPERIRKLALLNETMTRLAKEEAARLKYVPGRDVRRPLHWPSEKPVLIIGGDSGDGKTWQLAQLVANLGKNQEVVVLVRAATTTDETLTRVTRMVWQDGLGETSEKSPGALRLHYEDMNPGAQLPWMTIAVDDVRNIDILRDLIGQPWERWGMRLAVTVPRSVVDSLKYESSNNVHIHEVARFSVDEVDTLLQLYGQNWANLPRDLKTILRTPILAGLYTALSHESFQRAPHSEYEIFDRFWDRMRARVHAGDLGILMALAGRAIDGRSYPISRLQWTEVALTEDSLTRLDTAGWLRCDETGEVSLAHDRLLNWAAAKEIVRRLQTKQLSVEQIGAFIQECAQPQWGVDITRLDYLPMDVLWVLLKDESLLSEIVPLLAYFEEKQTFGGYGDALYRHLLPTLGIRVVPLLLARLDKLGSRDQSDYQARLVADAMTAVARQEGADLSSQAAHLIGTSQEIKQLVGIALLTITPVAGLLDRLWELHLERCKHLDSGQSHWRHNDYESSHAALRAGVNQHPDWLRKRLHNLAHGMERVSELGYLLSSLAHPSAATTWYETKAVLFAHMPVDRPRSLLYCIGRFGDTSEIKFLIACLNQRVDSAGGAALSGLVKLNPDLALQHLDDDSDGIVVLYRGWWLPELLHVRPRQTRLRLLEIAERGPDGRRFIEQLFSGKANDLDKSLLKFVLRSFTADLSVNLRSACKGDPFWMTFPLRLFNEISRPELLALLMEQSGSELESMIVQVACDRVGRSGRSHDYVLEEARTFLIRSGGSGISRLVNAELQSPDYWGRHRGLQWAMVRPNAAILMRLAEIARQVVTVDTKEKLSSEPLDENYSAMVALATLQADEALVDAIWNSEAPYFSVDLVDLRDSTQPMPKALTARATDVLATIQKANERDVVRALTTAWLSADPDFIDRVKKVLGQIDPLSEAAAYACAALQQLGDESDEFATFAGQMLSNRERRHSGINALFSLRDKGISYLIEYLNSIPVKEWQDLEIRVLRCVALHNTSHAFAVGIARQYCEESPKSLDLPFDIAAEAADAELRSVILEKAFDTDSIQPYRTYCAIKGLARFDNNRAIEAAIHHLKCSTHYERELCVLLTKMSPESAATLLLEISVATERATLRSASGRALRRLPPALVDEPITEGFKSANRHSRSVAVEMTGWLHTGRLAAQLDSLFVTETEDKVRSAIFSAHARQRDEATVMELFATFKGCSSERRWALLLSMLQVGDPVLLDDPEDSLWIGNVLNDARYMYWRHAKNELQQRIAKLK